MGTQVTCDRCGAIIPEYGRIQRLVHERYRINPIFLSEEKKPAKWELCECCADSFIMWFMHPELDCGDMADTDEDGEDAE